MLSMIVSWHNRIELKLAIPSMLESITAINGDLTIVNLNGDKDLLNAQLGQYKTQVSIIHATSKNKFNKPVAQNIGAKHTEQPYLFFCDCDIVLNPETLKTIVDQLTMTPMAFATLAGVKETQANARGANCLTLFGYELRLKIADGTEIKIIDNEENANDGTRQAPGLLLVRRRDFEIVDGYNSQLEGWGWEDQDMICRLQLKAKLQRISYGTALHISHDDHTRMGAYSNFTDRWQSRDHMFRCAINNYDQGNFTGTYRIDNETYSVTLEAKL